MIKEILSVRKYAAGYEVRTELIDGSEFGAPDFEVKSAYAPNGDYIGDSVWAYRLCKKRGIKPEKSKSTHNTCSIGFCEKNQKWYGWSHRAMHGFSVGDVVKEDDCAASSGWTDEYLEQHPEDDNSLPVGFRAENLKDTRKMAIAFADSVS